MAKVMTGGESGPIIMAETTAACFPGLITSTHWRVFRDGMDNSPLPVSVPLYRRFARKLAYWLLSI